MTDLVVVGTGHFGEVVREYFNEYSDYSVRAFAAHKDQIERDEMCGVPVVSIERLDQEFSPQSVRVFVAIGYRKLNKLRQAVYEDLKNRGFSFASFVFPDIKLWSTNHIGENVFIFENNTIQPFVEIGDNTILWSGNHIGHHSKIGRHCFISSHVVVSGSCQIGDNTFMGVNSALHDGIVIGSENILGAGAIVAKNTREREVYVPGATKVFPKTSDRLKF